MQQTTRVDVLVVGAGLSGIGAGYRLQTECPGLSYLIVEARDRLGGTWDLFRYPGIRSDSDMYTLGYPFRPWNSDKAIADGADILEYIRDTAEEFGIDQRIRFGHRVVRAAFSSQTGRWSVTVREQATGDEKLIVCRFLFLCAGYYRYDQGHDPQFPGRERFAGEIVHPQFWSDGTEYAGKRVVIIGSGATAVTLAPSMARSAAHVTVLQRSPTYVFSAPGTDRLFSRLRRRLSLERSYRLVRLKNILLGNAFYRYCRRYPERARRFLLGQLENRLGTDAVDSHFSPSYDPWDQRLCLDPDSVMQDAIRDSTVSMVTDHIESFTETGIALDSGRHLDADMIVTATGLELSLMGGVSFEVDGRTGEASELITYKGMMLGDVPNLAFAMGYTNASWTLKSDLVSRYVCRLLEHMQQTGADICVPRNRDPNLGLEPMIGLSAGYIDRARSRLPRQGDKKPWKLFQDYFLDLLAFRFGKLDDGVMEFSRASGSTDGTSAQTPRCRRMRIPMRPAPIRPSPTSIRARPARRTPPR